MLLALLLGALALPLAADLWIGLTARVAWDPRQLEPAECALVLGTAPVLGGGRPNAFFESRMDAAAALFAEGRVQRLILSGDAHRGGYDEPGAMQRALLARGIPGERLILDPRGLRTRDSLINARDQQGAGRVIVVSQAFHCARAQFLARHLGLEVQALAALDPESLRQRLKIRLREVGARSKAVLEVLFGAWS